METQPEQTDVKTNGAIREHQGQLTRIEDRLDRKMAGGITISTGGGVSFHSMNEVMEFAKLMAVGGIAVRKHLRGNPGVCLAVTMQAIEWGCTPYAVANQSFEINGQIGYQAQLVHAVIEARAPLKGRLRCRYEGEGPDRTCTVWGTFQGEDEPHEYKTPKVRDIPIKNSPLWKADPDQQLWYYASRSWARKWCSDVLLGIYTPEELKHIPVGEGAQEFERVINPLGGEPVRQIDAEPFEDAEEAHRKAAEAFQEQGVSVEPQNGNASPGASEEAGGAPRANGKKKG